MIVTTSNGTVAVVSGWRAWLLAALALVVVAFILGLMAFLVLGAAIAIGAVLLIVVPIAILFTVLASLFRSR